ncbi:MAG TPA: transporter substrate-binding protein [Hyphomicrobiales bacterium]|nr:transporter substrate-binding protein [Hyphomicrobiales bacterium]
MDRTASRADGMPVGILLSQTGPLASVESAHLRGTLLGIAAVNDAGGVLGRRLDPIVRDPGSDGACFRRLATDLVIRDGVQSLFGCCASDIRKTLVPIVERHDALLWYPTPFEGFEYSANVVYGGPCSNQHVLPLARYLLARGRHRFFFIGSDYVFPRECNRVMRAAVEDAGGMVVGEAYLPLDAGDNAFGAAIHDGFAEDPDVIFSTVVGPATMTLFAAYRRLGGDPVRTPIATICTCEAEMAQRPELFCDHITALAYFESLDGAANRRFLGAFRRRFGAQAHANSLVEASYDQVLLFARAAARAGSVAPADIVAALPEIEFDAPQGRCRIDRDSNYVYCRPRIGRATDNGTFTLIEEADEMVKPDPYLIAYA